ncbi:hypothetical protein Tco_0368032 [Tanacetum coccineum]
MTISRKESKVPHPRSPTQAHVANEAVSFGKDDRMERAATIISSLEIGQDNGNINRTQSMATPVEPSSPRAISEGGPGCHFTMGDTPVQTRSKGYLQCLNVVSLEENLKQTKLVYGTALTKLIKKFKKLEQKDRSNTARRRANFFLSDDEEDLGVEDASKQGRKIAQIDQDEGITLVQVDAETQGRYGHDVEFDTSVFDEPKVYPNQRDAAKDVSAAKPVTTAGVEFTTPSVSVTTASVAVSTASPTRTASVSTDDITLAETLVYIRRSAVKDKEVAQRIYAEEQAKFKAEQKIARETTVKEPNPPDDDIDWDDVQAQIQANEDLAQKILEEERESLCIEERSRLLAEFIDKRKKL